MNQFASKNIPKIKEKLLHNLCCEGKTKVKKALRIIEDLTKDRYRLNGDPLISHPIMVALKVKSMGLGTNSICAAILHDVIEDYPQKQDVHQKIQRELGDDIYGLIKCLSRINSTPAEKSQLSE